MKKVLCSVCEIETIEIPESIEVEKPYCRACYKREFGEGYMSYVEKNAEEYND